jgi:dolichol-phosphate mannosyltransferase
LDTQQEGGTIIDNSSQQSTAVDPSQLGDLDHVHDIDTSSNGCINPLVSIIIPTFNESENILKLIQSIRRYIEHRFSAEVIVVDDNSPDKTGKIVKEYAHNLDSHNIYQQQYNTKELHKQQIFSVRVICRHSKEGLVSALLEGVKNSLGNYIVILDADFSHPPNVVVDMVNELQNSHYDIVSASRYLKGGQIIGWPLRRHVISRSAALLARTILRFNHITDPISGFFAFKRDVVTHITFSTTGYKLLLEILVKANNAKVKEIPYTFTDRKSGSSKLDTKVILDYVKAILHLYTFKKSSNSFRHKQKRQTNFNRKAKVFIRNWIPVRL